MSGYVRVLHDEHEGYFRIPLGCDGMGRSITLIRSCRLIKHIGEE